MAVTSTPVCVQTPKASVQQILNADASGWKTVVTGGTNGTKVTGLMLTSTDTSSRIVQVAISRGGTHYIFGTVTVAITAGTDGTTAAVAVFSSSLIPNLPVDNDGQPYIFLSDASDTLDISSTTTVTSGKILNAVAVQGNF